MAFLSPIQLPVLHRGARPATSRRTISAKAKKPTRSKSTPASSKPTESTDVEALKTRLLQSLSSLDRGLTIDPDAEVLTPEEAVVEDIIILLEDASPQVAPTSSPDLAGTWELLYTSSSITRFFGGVTGLTRLLPAAETGSIQQVIDAEDGTSRYVERMRFELPLFGEKEWVAEAEGKFRGSSEVRMLWEPENVKVGWFSWFADSWKTLRAFQVSDITYLDDTLRITRGTTGSVNVYEKV